EDLLRRAGDGGPVDAAALERLQLVDLGLHLLEARVVRHVAPDPAVDRSEESLQLRARALDDLVCTHGRARIERSHRPSSTATGGDGGPAAGWRSAERVEGSADRVEEGRDRLVRAGDDLLVRRLQALLRGVL